MLLDVICTCLLYTSVNSDIAAGYDQYEALQLGTCTPRTGFLNGKWQNGYNAIQRANLAIRSIGEAPIDEVPKNQMLGEARFLRALIYFHLLDYFGGLPIYDETTDLEKEFNNLLKDVYKRQAYRLSVAENNRGISATFR